MKNVLRVLNTTQKQKELSFEPKMYHRYFENMTADTQTIYKINKLTLT